MSRFNRLRLGKNGCEELEESFSHMNRLKFTESLWDVQEETLQSMHYEYKILTKN